MAKFVIKPSGAGFSFSLKAGNGQVIATSQTYKTLATCKKGIASVQRTAPVAPIENQTEEDFAVEKNPKFEVYNDKAGKARFRLKASNGQIIVTGQAYKSLKSCLNGIESIKKNAPVAEIETLEE